MTEQEKVRKAIDQVHSVMHTEPLLDSRKLAIEALEKQIPKKPRMRHIKSFDGYNDGWCPCCGEYVQECEYDMKYCQDCGQKLDWSEEEE